MITKRIIPCLDVRNGRVVKGKNFEGIQAVSDPVEMAKFYNRAGADVVQIKSASTAAPSAIRISSDRLQRNTAISAWC